jgi:hypothetical protein
MPEHDVRLPSRIDRVFLALLQHFVQFLSLDVACVVGVRLTGWLTQHHFLSQNTARDQLVKGTLRIEFTRVDEERVVGVIASVDLVVELDVVEIDVLAHLGIDGEIGASWRVIRGEVGALRGVGDDVEWQFAPERRHKSDHPVFARPVVESFTIFVVNVDTVSLIGLHELCELDGALDRIVPFGCRILAGSEGTDQ